jgi:hypothetical protein
MEFPPPEAPATNVGTPDFSAAERLTNDLTDSGIDMTGVTVWVFHIGETDSRMLVLDITPEATSLAEGDGLEDLLVNLSMAASLPDARVDRFVMHYRDEGFVLTITGPLVDVFAALNSGGDVYDVVQSN